MARNIVISTQNRNLLDLQKDFNLVLKWNIDLSSGLDSFDDAEKTEYPRS